MYKELHPSNQDTQRKDVGFLVIMLKEKKRGKLFQWFKNLPYQRPPVPNWVCSVVERAWGGLALEEGCVEGERAVKQDRPQAEYRLFRLRAAWAQTVAHIRF